MAKSEKQKQKLFRILEILMQKTDDAHGLTVNEIISELDYLGIRAERKSIYDDFLVLEEIGFPVLKLAGRPPRYTLESRVFETAELKMLVDAVQSSKFITAKKSREIISKLEMFAGERGARALSRQVYVEDRAKTDNSTTIYSIDSIHEAINSKKQLSFKYFDYDGNKNKVYRHDSKTYEVSPCALIWNDQNYYLVAYEEAEDLVKNYRVDKMSGTRVEEKAMSSSDKVKNFNPADYSMKIFGMYGGKEELVTLEFSDSLAGVVIDRFGVEPTFIKTDFGFKITLRVMVSPNFYAWILGFGEKARILEPDPVRREFCEILEKTTKLYKN